jgi:hypothetical protein
MSKDKNLPAQIDRERGNPEELPNPEQSQHF